MVLSGVSVGKDISETLVPREDACGWFDRFHPLARAVPSTGIGLVQARAASKDWSQAPKRGDASTKRTEVTTGEHRVRQGCEVVADDGWQVFQKPGCRVAPRDCPDLVSSKMPVLERRSLAGARRVSVTDDRRGGDDAVPSREPGAPREVDILEVHEIRRIEAAKLPKHCAPVEGGTCACAEDGDWRTRLDAWFAGSTIPGDAGAVDPNPRRLDGFRVVREDHLACDAADAFVLRGCCDQGVHPSWFRDCVVVQGDDQLASRLTGGAIIGRGEPLVRGVADQSDPAIPGRELGDDIGSAIARVVVDNDHLEPTGCLLGKEGRHQPVEMG